MLALMRLVTFQVHHLSQNSQCTARDLVTCSCWWWFMVVITTSNAWKTQNKMMGYSVFKPSGLHRIAIKNRLSHTSETYEQESNWTTRIGVNIKHILNHHPNIVMFHDTNPNLTWNNGNYTKQTAFLLPPIEFASLLHPTPSDWKVPWMIRNFLSCGFLLPVH